MLKYLFFQNNTLDSSTYPNDSALLPAASLVDMQISADGTDLTLSLDSLLQSKGVGENFKGQLTARAEYFKAAGTMFGNYQSSGSILSS